MAGHRLSSRRTTGIRPSGQKRTEEACDAIQAADVEPAHAGPDVLGYAIVAERIVDTRDLMADRPERSDVRDA
jgi:hypothetical protein